MLAGIADAFLVGERPIARRVDDSVARAGVFGPVVLRRARGYAPSVVGNVPLRRPILALGADLKNAIALSVDGQIIVSQHIGDLEHYGAFKAFRQTVADLLCMYDLRPEELLLVHDAHPQYAATQFALTVPAPRRVAVQHHRAHVASVLAERESWDQPVLGIAWDGTGYGDDGSIWGGEIFAGSLRRGLVRVAHLRPAMLAGGDAAARHPVQAAAGYLDQLDSSADFQAAPFDFPQRYRHAAEILRHGVHAFPTTSVGRLFDAAAALAGFTRPVTFEGQAAMWLEHLARQSASREAYSFPLRDGELDFRPLLAGFTRDRLRRCDPADSARAFHRGLARGLVQAIRLLAAARGSNTVVLSGGVFQNQLLVEDLREALDVHGLQVWTNSAVPPNDGGISLGQVALAACGE
jgi:hydrogenase maturation protein HypF